MASVTATASGSDGSMVTRRSYPAAPTPGAPTTAGTVFVLAQAGAVVVLTELQLTGLRRARTAAV